jgi:hypothetical protein
MPLVFIFSLVAHAYRFSLDSLQSSEKHAFCGGGSIRENKFSLFAAPRTQETENDRKSAIMYLFGPGLDSVKFGFVDFIDQDRMRGNPVILK